MTGITQDKENLLGLTGNDAYSMSGSKSNTTFAAFKAQNKLKNNLTLTGIASLAKTDMTKPSDSFINSASNVKSSSLSGLDSLLSIVQMPGGVPVGTLAIGPAGAKNAALLACQILALDDDDLANRVSEWRQQQTENVANLPVELTPE